MSLRKLFTSLCGSGLIHTMAITVLGFQHSLSRSLRRKCLVVVSKWLLLVSGQYFLPVLLASFDIQFGSVLEKAMAPHSSTLA